MRNVLLIAIALVGAGCGPAMPSGRLADQRFDVEVFENLEYGSAPDEDNNLESLRLDLYRPAGEQGELPTLVLVHGGGFNHGKRSEYATEAAAYARRGYVVATIDYRVREKSLIWFGAPSEASLQIVTDARHDAQASVRWLRANADAFGVDRRRIAIAGYSAGAIVAVGVGASAEDPGTSGTPDQPSNVCLAISISGTAVDGSYASDDAPLLMFHGADDPIVPTNLARQTAFAAGVGRQLIGYHEFAGVGHLLPYQRDKDISAIMVRELRDQLADGPGC